MLIVTCVYAPPLVSEMIAETDSVSNPVLVESLLVEQADARPENLNRASGDKNKKIDNITSTGDLPFRPPIEEPLGRRLSLEQDTVQKHEPGESISKDNIVEFQTRKNGLQIGTAQVPAGEQFFQMQVLTQEVLVLRGLVEELAYKLSRMQATQEDRYLELDGRLQLLRHGNDVKTTEAETEDINKAVEADKLLYEEAVNSIRNRQYESAILQLQTVISRYPDSTYAPNAYYWLGEVFAAKPKPDYEKARQALSQVLKSFPDSHKAPDAAFKLGKVYHLMGDCKRSIEYLDQVIQAQRGRTVAKLAESYLREKVGACS
ncbi:MAG: tetratricopeptide repeat protein [Pseudomonadales bacterium]|nr:tetratricopeptide repeat protein [Pseudomonadales bacterium]